MTMFLNEAGRVRQMTVLLSLIMGWAGLLLVMERAGTISTYLAVEALSQFGTR